MDKGRKGMPGVGQTECGVDTSIKPRAKLSEYGCGPTTKNEVTLNRKTKGEFLLRWFYQFCQRKVDEEPAGVY